MSRRVWIWGISLILLATFPCLGEEKGKPGTPLRPLSEILKTDGTLNLGQGVEGSFDPRGFRMVTERGQAPRFVPASPRQSSSEQKLPAPAPGDEYWDGGYGLSGPGGDVYALAVSGSTLYAGGRFTTAGGESVNNIAKWDGTSWSALGSGMDAEVLALAVSGTDLFAGGYFSTAGGVSANMIAKWDGTSWAALDSGMDYGVNSLAVISSALYAGGDFTTAGGKSSRYIGLWHFQPQVQKDDLLGTWDGQGVYYRNSDSSAWAYLASPADLIAAGDLDGDGIADLIGIWPSQGGVWTKYSGTGLWALLASTAHHIAAGDMNGDGRKDLVGTWDGQGVYYRNSIDGTWVQMASPADLVTAGDLDGDGKDDLIGIWPSQGGVWVKYSKTGGWELLSSTAKDITAGDMNGDGRVDFVGTWDGQGVFYKDSVTGAWVQMASPADQITTGDLDGDGIADLIGIWPGQGGVWAKYSSTGQWAYLGSTARDISAGKMRAAGALSVKAVTTQMSGYAGGPGVGPYVNLSDLAPGGKRFVHKTAKNLVPQVSGKNVQRAPGPGEPGFRCVKQANLVPHIEAEKGGKKAEIKKK